MTFTGGEPRFENWSDLVTKVGTFGGNESLEGTLGALAAYFEGLGTISGTFVGGTTFSGLNVAGWDLTALKEALTRRAGRATSVDVTMYVVRADGTGWNVWREFGYTDIGSELEYVRGFSDSYLLFIDGKWVYPSIEQAHDALVDPVNERGMIAGAAQPVTVTVTIGEQGDFEWSAPTVPGGDDVTPDTPDTYSFSDGSATALNGGVQTYQITTAEQLYGAMPESGSVVHPDGTTKRAAFDWNGFAYDTGSAFNVARLSVTSGGDRIDTDVVVTLADNADVQDAASALDAEPATEATPVTVVAPNLRAMSIDPLKYGTLGAFIAANRDGGELEVKLADGSVIPVTVVNWSDKLASDAALPLAGARYTDNIATFKGEDNTLYQAVVPIIVNARVIEDAEVLLGEGFTLVSQTRRFAETVRRYVAAGQVIEVSYSRDTHLPTGITVMNPYAYDRDTVFGEVPEMEITFADGYVASYTFALDVADPKSGNESATSTEKWSAGTLNGTLEFMYSALRITGANMLSDIAYGDLGGTLDGTYQDFAPYANMTLAGKTLLTPHEINGQKLTSNVRVFIDGMFVLASDLERYTTPVAGMTAPRYTELEGYRYNADGTYNAQGEYAYVYAAEYTFEQSALTWDNSGISYNYNGGVRRTTVDIEVAGLEGAGLKGTMQMPIYIENGRVASLSFTPNEQGSYAAYFESGNTEGINYFNANWNGSKLVFDPFNADGKMYDIDAAFTTHTETDGSVVIDSYLYFPVKADVVTARGAVIEGVAITWSNLGAIRNSYGGGKFDARITLPAVTEGEGDKAETIIPAQGYTLREFVIVQDRSFADGATLNGIDTLPTEGKVVKEGEQTEQTYIDPLSFDLSVWQKDVEAIESVSIGINGKENPVTFDKDGTDGYTLTWVYTGMNVSYLGGKVSLVARLTGPDGYAQDYSIDYLVSRVVASKIVERNKSTGVVGGVSFNFGTDVAIENFGRADETYTVQPYDPSTFEMPASWQITYTYFNPNKDGSFGTDMTAAKNPTENVTYLRASMPAGAKVTYDNAKKGVDSAGDAMITLGSGQRVRIPVTVAAKSSTQTSFTASGNKLPSRTSNGVGIVWYGRVFIDSSANYIVSFSVADAGSDGNITLPAINGRTATYVLTAYVGAVVDANGKVLDWNSEGKLPTSSSQKAYDSFGENIATTGRQVPTGARGSTLAIQVNG